MSSIADLLKKFVDGVGQVLDQSDTAIGAVLEFVQILANNSSGMHLVGAASGTPNDAAPAKVAGTSGVGVGDTGTGGGDGGDGGGDDGVGGGDGA